MRARGGGVAGRCAVHACGALRAGGAGGSPRIGAKAMETAGAGTAGGAGSAVVPPAGFRVAPWGGSGGGARRRPGRGAAGRGADPAESEAIRETRWGVRWLCGGDMRGVTCWSVQKASLLSVPITLCLSLFVCLCLSIVSTPSVSPPLHFSSLRPLSRSNEVGEDIGGEEGRGRGMNARNNGGREGGKRAGRDF